MNERQTRPHGLRRSKVVAKGGTFEAIAKAHASKADVVQIELEGGFPPEQRPAAVDATCRALEELDWTKTEAWVRLPSIDSADAIAALPRVLAGRPQLIYCAKVKTAADVQKLSDEITRLEPTLGLSSGSTQVGAVIERVEALANVESIATATSRMGAIMFGANDMSLDFGYRRTGTPEMAYETLYIRSRMVLAGRLAGIDIFDATYMDFSDLESSEADARFSARMGFTGKTAISPVQVEGIHRAFVPTERELIWANAVVAAAAHPIPEQRLVDDDRIDATDHARALNLLGRAR
ncbi:MAG: CoA ester lyase [Mesorhizobium sp.]|nr:CoA ester lyase [Mesorhizobium sp.]